APRSRVALLYSTWPPWSAIDERRVGLYQRGPGLAPFSQVVGGGHTADGDQCETVANVFAQEPQHCQRTVPQWGPGHSPFPRGGNLFGVGPQAAASHRGVGGDDAVHAEFEYEVGDGSDIV